MREREIKTIEVFKDFFSSLDMKELSTEPKVVTEILIGFFDLFTRKNDPNSCVNARTYLNREKGMLEEVFEEVSTVILSRYEDGQKTLK